MIIEQNETAPPQKKLKQASNQSPYTTVIRNVTWQSLVSLRHNRSNFPLPILRMPTSHFE